MQTEIEAKFLNVNHDAIRTKLKQLGATCERPMQLMHRKNYDFPDWRLKQKHAWARIRDEGDKVIMSYKQMDARTVDGMLELTVIVDSFENADQFMAALGLITKNYQETRRETWRFSGCELVLDEWPWVRPSMEIEGPNEKSLRAIAEKLGLNWSTALFGSVELVYQAEYEISDDDFNHLPIVTFTEPVPSHWRRKQVKRQA